MKCSGMGGVPTVPPDMLSTPSRGPFLPPPIPDTGMPGCAFVYASEDMGSGNEAVMSRSWLAASAAGDPQACARERSFPIQLESSRFIRSSASRDGERTKEFGEAPRREEAADPPPRQDGCCCCCWAALREEVGGVAALIGGRPWDGTLDPVRMGIATDGAAAVATLLPIGVLLLTLRDMKEEKSLEVWASPMPMLLLGVVGVVCWEGKGRFEAGGPDAAPLLPPPAPPAPAIMAFESPPLMGAVAGAPAAPLDEDRASCFRRAVRRPAPTPESPCCRPEHSCCS